MKYYVVRRSDSHSMFSRWKITFFRDGKEISVPRAGGGRKVLPEDKFECILQTGRDSGAEVADILKAAGHADVAHDAELRRERGVSDIYQSEGIVSEELFQILHEASPEHVFGAEVSLYHVNEKVKYPYRFLLIDDEIPSAGRQEVPGVCFWGAKSFKPEQAAGKVVFLLGDDMPGAPLRGILLKLLCVDEALATKIKSANLSGVHLSEFRT